MAALPELGGSPARAAVDDLGWQPKLLTPEQAQTLSRTCDLLLPGTETAGAVEAGVPEWIDLNASLAPAAERLTLIGGLTWLDDRSTKLHGSRFVELPEADQVSMLREISDEHDDHPADLQAGAAFFADTKRQTLFAYFTSRKGRTEALGRPDKVEREVWQGCSHDGDHSA